MAQEQNLFQRLTTRIVDFIRPETRLDLHVQEMVRQVQANEDRMMIEDARAKATESLINLRGLTQKELRTEFTAHHLDQAEIPDHPDRSWRSTDQLNARVDQDVAYLAQNSGRDLDTTEAKIAAYAELEETYDSIGLEIRLEREFAARREVESDGPNIVHGERWQVSIDNPSLETRAIVVQTDAGYHPAYEESYMGGDGPISFSDQAFDNLAKAKTLSWSYQDGGEKALTHASQTYDSAIDTITGLSQQDKLSIGQQAQLLDALSEIEVGLNGVSADNTDALSAWSDKAEDRERLAGLIDSHKDQLRYSSSIQREMERVGVDRHDPAAVDSYVQNTFGSEEAIVRQFRVSETLQSIGSAVAVGQMPMFQSREDMEALRQDVEKTYGDGSFDRLRAGNGRDVEYDFPREDVRQQISMGLSGMVHNAEQHSSEELRENHAVAALEKRMKSADWYYDYSDDSDVRGRGWTEVKALREDVAAYAAQSPAAAERISQSWDDKTPRDVGRFPGYLPESERTNTVAQGNDAGNALSAAQDRER